MNESDPREMADVLRQQIAAERELSTRLRDHAGEWVAVRDHDVVAHAQTLEELMERVRDTKEEGTVEVFEVSTEPESAYFF